MAKYDDILSDINDYGVYQKIRVLLICIAGLLPSIATYMHSFIAAVPRHWCNESGDNSDPFLVSNLTQSAGKCTYQLNNATEKCTSWSYDRTYYKSTLTEQWSLVCDRSYLNALVQIIYFGGYLLGSIVLGNLSDKFGRRPILLTSFIIIIIGTSGVFFFPQIPMNFHAGFVLFTISRFLIACGTRGINETGYVLALELVGQKRRSSAAITFELFFPSGQLLLVLLAYFTRDWRLIAGTIMAMSVPFLSYFFILPESPRWLISKSRSDEAFKILEDIAKANKTRINKETWGQFIDEGSNSKPKNENFFSLLKSLIQYPSQLILILTMFLNWCGSNLIFYGVGLKSSNLGLNPYLTFAVSAFVELLGIITAFMVVDKFGRKKLYFTFLFTAGSACFSIVFIHDKIAAVVLAMIGKFSVALSYSVLRLYSNEIFPTSIRNTCMGLCSMVGRIGVMFAPAIISIGDSKYEKLPFLVFGITGIVSALTTLILPETLNRNLPDNLDEAQKVNRIGLCLRGEPTVDKNTNFLDNTSQNEIEMITWTKSQTISA